jgi:membrane-bound serine protease (ClpP class)
MPVEMYRKTVFGSPKVFALFLLALAFTSTAVLSAKPQSQPSQQTAAVASNPAGIVKLRIDGEIEPILADYITNGIERAAQEHAALVLITIDTPGGLDTSMRQIIAKILASPVPVVTFVSPTGSRAASAGFFILLSAGFAGHDFCGIFCAD